MYHTILSALIRKSRKKIFSRKQSFLYEEAKSGKLKNVLKKCYGPSKKR